MGILQSIFKEKKAKLSLQLFGLGLITVLLMLIPATMVESNSVIVVVIAAILSIVISYFMYLYEQKIIFKNIFDPKIGKKNVNGKEFYKVLIAASLVNMACTFIVQTIIYSILTLVQSSEITILLVLALIISIPLIMITIVFKVVTSFTIYDAIIDNTYGFRETVKTFMELLKENFRIIGRMVIKLTIAGIIAGIVAFIVYMLVLYISFAALINGSVGLFMFGIIITILVVIVIALWLTSAYYIYICNNYLILIRPELLTDNQDTTTNENTNVDNTFEV